MEYTSLRQIRTEFGIESEELNSIRDELNRIRFELHPDKNNGDFASEEVKEKYYKVSNAINFIDDLKNNQSLVVMEKMTDLVKTIAELIPTNKISSLEQTLDNKITTALSTFRSRLTIPKISLATLTAVFTFIFLFPGQVKDHPTLSKYIDPSSNRFAILWLVTLMYSGFFWILTFLNEEKAKRKLSLLKVDSTQNRIFGMFINEEHQGYRFTKDKLTQYIYSHTTGDRPKVGEEKMLSIFKLISGRLFGSEIITLEIAQNIAEVIISRAVSTSLIVKISRPGLSDVYEIRNFDPD